MSHTCISESGSPFRSVLVPQSPSAANSFWVAFSDTASAVATLDHEEGHDAERQTYSRVNGADHRIDAESDCPLQVCSVTTSV